MLSRKTKYGLKALGYLARQDRGRPTPISTISETEQISQKFLESILLSMKKAGLLASKKGKGGGYYLLKDPKEISITTVYRTLEGPVAMVPCVSLNFYKECEDCPDEASCKVHRLMMQVRDNTLSILENTTLDDFISEN